MGFCSTTSFASASAAGADWREAAKAVLEQLAGAVADRNDFTIGFLYVSDLLAEDMTTILNLFRSVTQIPHWVGSVGLGVCGTGVEYVDEPAISVMVGRIPPQDLCLFPAFDLNPEPAREALEPWIDKAEPMLVLVHGDPLADNDPARGLAALENMVGGFLAGGLSSSRTVHAQIADEVMQGGLSGVAFSQSVPVATSLSQGCAPIGPVHTVTRCEDHVIMELDGQRAFDVFADDLRAMASEKSGRRDGEDVMPDFDPLVESLGSNFGDGDNDDDLFRGEVHVAFPVPGSDQQDYLVRNILGLDPDKGWVAAAHHVENGDQMMFVHRDNNTVRVDLTRSLISLRKRVESERGVFDPKGALYISCVARTMSDFGDGPGGEMALVREIIGDVPLAGFYANGEISSRRLYGYTAVLILFL